MESHSNTNSVSKQSISFRTVAKFFFDLKEFIILLIFLISLAQSPFQKPEITVFYEINQSYRPYNSLAILDSLTMKISDEKADIETLRNYLTSNEYMLIDIRNNTNELISQVDLKVNNVNKITGIAMHTSSSVLKVLTDSLVQYVLHPDNTLSFSNFRSLPPKAKLSFVIWGSFVKTFFTNQVHLESTAKSSEIKIIQKVTGISVFIEDNLVGIAIIVCMFSLLIGLRRLRN